MGVGERDPRGADQSRLQCRRRHAGRRHADPAHARASSSDDARLASSSKCRHRHRHGRGDPRRCLEPFFTTKGERGTGLGLAMVYGIAQRHGADIEIESAAGQGHDRAAVFADAAQPRCRIGAEQTSHAARCGASAHPVVDDDPLLLKSLRDTLGRMATSSSPPTAVRPVSTRSGAARSTANAFDVVITDLGMPYVDGRQVAAAIKALSPETPVILLTGWGERLIAENDMPPHVDRILSKPPRLRELRGALNEPRPRSLAVRALKKGCIDSRAYRADLDSGERRCSSG